MRFAIVVLFATVVSAHFQLQFPPARGPFADEAEPTFCDGYQNPGANRSLFPLSGGFYKIKVGHPQWLIEALISTGANATSFADFSQVNTFNAGKGLGEFCLPLDFSKSNVTGLQDGQNVTIQIVFNGGDGNLYQCADVTLASNLNLSSTVSCSNSTTTSGAMSKFGGSVPLLSALAGLSGVLLL